jgi:formylglycine-generating enzyme
MVTLTAGQEPALNRTLEAEQRLKPGDIWWEPTTGMEFVWIPGGGCFEMGSEKGDSNEKPIHEVCLDGFWMGKTEVSSDGGEDGL